MVLRFGTQPRRFPVEGGDSPVGRESGLNSSAACDRNEISPNRNLPVCQLRKYVLGIISNSEDAPQVIA
uniref:Family with sequence similarity 229 member B n=1 Tax=Chinchilla lanigera TaxID=34839 RepID=A0A8C2UI29_CHILA